MLNSVMYVTVFVRDQDKALDFYTRVLGLEKRADTPTPSGARFLTVAPTGEGPQIVLWPGTPGAATSSNGPIPGAIILGTSDCRKDVEVLTSRGAELEAPIVEQPRALVAVLRDPDGNRLMLRENR